MSNPIASTPQPGSEDAAAEGAPHKTYRAGTLDYTKGGLVILFSWLLWGDFSFTFFEQIFDKFLPIYARTLHASNTLIGLMTGSFAGVVHILFLPGISQWSDRTRHRLGRRIPFLYVVAPITVVSLVALGMAPEIAGWVQAHVLVHFAPAVTMGGLTLVLLCAFVISYHFFNMVLVNGYNWLIRDVVPQKVISRFLSGFKMVGSVGTFIFFWWVFPQVLSHRREVFFGIGALFLVSFLLMCRNVKEGGYPPPPSRADRPSVVKTFALYFRDCLSIPVYRNLFFAYLLAILASTCAGPFFTLFTKETLGLTMDNLGKITAWGTASSLAAFLPIGWLCDRFSPIRVALVAFFLHAVLALLGCLLIHDRISYLVYAVVLSFPSVGWRLGVQAASMKLFPKERFGEFFSGLSIFAFAAMIPGNFLMGRFMDLVHSDYRMAFFWSAFFYLMAIYPMVLVYRGWKRHGGPDNYVAPLPAVTAR